MNVISLHEQVWNALQARRAQLPHALLLIGQRGIGKFELARQFAASLLCEQPQMNGQACGECLACNWFSQGNHPDFRLLQPEAASQESEAGEEGKKKASQQITIEQVRAIDDFLNVGTHRAGLRIILLNPTEAMNRNAANAILKSLEEPTPSTLFLLVSSEPLRLLPTIRSRCQSIPVALPSAARSMAALKAAGVNDPERWLALAGGSPELAIDMAASGQAAWLDILAQRLAAGKKGDPLACAAELEKQIKEGKGKLALRSVVEAMQKWVVDLNMARNGLPARYFLPQQATISALADMIPPLRLLHAYRDLHSRRREAEQPVNARLFLEGLFLDYRALFATDR
jgi:DNA polymerase-3 subunit delta'